MTHPTFVSEFAPGLARTTNESDVLRDHPDGWTKVRAPTVTFAPGSGRSGASLVSAAVDANDATGKRTVRRSVPPFPVTVTTSL
jgi:hypothetical protein